MCNTLTLSALNCDFPFPALSVANFIPPHREQVFLQGKICLFCVDNFTMWVAREHRLKLERCMVVDKARALTENSNAPCIVRKEVRMSIQDAHELLRKCEIKRLTVMQYGQKADFANKVVQWALKNVRQDYTVLAVHLSFFFFFFRQQVRQS